MTGDGAASRARSRATAWSSRPGAWAEELGRKAGGRPARHAPIERHLFLTEPVAALAGDHRRGAPFVWHAPGLFWVAGLGGHGATGSAAVGQRAAALVLERVG